MCCKNNSASETESTANLVDRLLSFQSEDFPDELNLPKHIPALAKAAASNTWIAKATDLSPLWDYTWLKFLWIVVPGTIVGDWLRRWSSSPLSVSDIAHDPALATNSYPRWTILFLAIATTVAVCAGLRHYGFDTLGVGGPLRTPWLALILALPPVGVMMWLVMAHTRSTSWLANRLCAMGTAFLLIGLALACLPSSSATSGFFEGGISKGPPATLSYYATTVGLCCLLLTGLFGVLDLRAAPSLRPGLLEANGQNPLLAYFLAHVVIGCIFGLGIFTPLHALGALNFGRWADLTCLDDLGHFPDHPWLGAAWGAIKTLTIACVVWILTLKKIYWRA